MPTFRIRERTCPSGFKSCSFRIAGAGCASRGLSAFLKKEKCQQHAECLRNDGRERGAHGTHGEGTDQNIVQNDIDDAGGEDEDHRTFRVAQSAEDAADDVIGSDKGDADEADQDIPARLFKSFRRCGKDPQNRVSCENQQRGDQHREDGKNGDCGADIPPGLPRVLCADRVSDRYGRAHRESDNNDCQHMHQLGADGDSRDRGSAVEPARDEQIRQTVEGLQKAGDQVWNGEVQQISEDTAAGQITSFQGCPHFRSCP